MARVTRSKKVQPSEEQTNSCKTRNNTTEVQSTCTQLHTKESDIPQDEDNFSVMGPMTLNLAMKMISGSVSKNTNKKCKLVVRSPDKSRIDLRSHNLPIKQVNKLAKNKEIDPSIKGLMKNESPISTPFNSIKNNNASSYLVDGETVNNNEPAKNSCDSLVDLGPTIIDDGEDSFIAQIISRSPAKPVSRLEDSIEGFDQLETAIEVLEEAAQVRNTVGHKPIPRPRGKATSESKPTITRKVSSVIPQKISETTPSKAQSPSKRKKNSSHQVTDHNKLTHSSIKLEVSRKTPPNSTRIDLYKSQLRPTPIDSQRQIIKPSKDQAEKQFSKMKYAKIAHEVLPNSLPKIKESKSLSSLKRHDSHDDVFTRLSTGTHKSRSSSQRFDEKRTQTSMSRKSCLVSHFLTHEASNLNSCDSSREKNLSANPSRPLIKQTSQKILSSIKSPSQTFSRDVKPTLCSSLKHTSDAHTIKSTPGQNFNSKAVNETCRNEINLDKDIEKEIQERKKIALMARAQAAEKGRQAVMEWAEKQKNQM